MKHTIIVEVEADPSPAMAQYLAANAVTDLIVEGIAVEKVTVHDNSRVVFEEGYTPESRKKVIEIAEELGQKV